MTLWLAREFAARADVNLSLCDAGHDVAQGERLPACVRIEGLATETAEVFLCHRHRQALHAMLQRRYPHTIARGAVPEHTRSEVWLRGDEPATGWTEVTRQFVDHSRAAASMSVRAWWLMAIDLEAKGLWEFARDDRERLLMRQWHIRT